MSLWRRAVAPNPAPVARLTKSERPIALDVAFAPIRLPIKSRNTRGACCSIQFVGGRGRCTRTAEFSPQRPTFPSKAEGAAVELSLSVVLPVHDAEATLAERARELLEILPEIAPDFEILIVDDASSDQTEEIADQLIRRYPQLLYTRHRNRQGADAAVRTGMTRTRGRIVMVQDQAAKISISKIRHLWNMRHDDELVMARAEAPPQTLSPQLLERLGSWAEQLRTATVADSATGVQMIRRRAVEEMDSPEQLKRPVHLCHLPTDTASVHLDPVPGS
jgi:hypothetical protein